MSSVEFEPTIPVIERAKTACTLDGAATVIGKEIIIIMIKLSYITNIWLYKWPNVWSLFNTDTEDVLTRPKRDCQIKLNSVFEISVLRSAIEEVIILR
jgi:hypothetical protein